ncbi:hypothetical protein lerEdw1_009863 [Lerista edwardsae]|nr:hypothetical protein lerEdw1_009863 [Lerista edwardsae]
MKLFVLALAVWGAAASPIGTEDIVNGYECPAHSVPWQVYFTTDGNRWCGGSLINEWWIVSAAHCYVPANTLVAHLGEHDTTQREGTEQALKASLVIRHPNYNDKTQDNDIMLVKLAQPARFNQYVSPIQLPNSCPVAGTWCLTSGWGNLLTHGVAYPQKLQCLREPIIPSTQCKQAYPYYYSNNMMCAGFLQGGESTCQGDSGGPLECNGLLEGIVSWGYECAMKGHPTVYTKVCNYTPWIHQMMSYY